MKKHCLNISLALTSAILGFALLVSGPLLNHRAISPSSDGCRYSDSKLTATEMLVFKLADWMHVESLIRNASKPNRDLNATVC